MSRTNIDIDEEAGQAVMERFHLSSKRAAVNFALRTLAAQPLDLVSARRLRGSGWDGELDDMRPEVSHHAGDLAKEFSLRGADAVHLASALALSDQALVVPVWDRQLHAGAVSARLAVAPVTLDPP